MMNVVSIHEVKLRKLLSAKELLLSGKYSEINYLIHESIKFNFFEIKKSDIGSWKLAILKFNSQDSIPVDLIQTIIAKEGFRNPLPIDTLLLGSLLTANDFSTPYVFLHNPRYFWSGILFNLVLTQDKNSEKRITFKSSGGYWDSSYYFVFRMK